MTYTIISGADDSFRIDPESGDLIATRKLDRERRSKYSLLVRADDGKQSSDMMLNITVQDVNDHSPKFSRATYSFDIPEDTAAGESWDRRRRRHRRDQGLTPPPWQAPSWRRSWPATPTPAPTAR